MRGPNEIMGPQHVHAGVTTAEEYRAWQADTIRRFRVAYANLPWRDPWRWTGPAPPVFVSGGKAVLKCATGCGNYPVVSVAWGLACCAEPGCGAVYEDLRPPDRWDEIVAALLARPEAHTRHWAPPETVEDLWAENVAHGIVRPVVESEAVD